jgi:uncharacterized RDD family membrane protein YckC
LLGSSSQFAIAAPRDLQAHGSDERLWLARVEPATQKGAADITQLYVRVKNESNWKRLEPISARVLSIGNRGSQLAVLLAGGDWRLTTDAGFASGRPLPDGGKIVALGSGPAALWAVGAAPPAATSRATTQSRPSTSPAMSALPGSANTLTLYRFGAQGWESQATLPADLSYQVISLGEANGQPILACQTGARSVRVFSFDSSKKWVTVADVESPVEIKDIELLGGTATPVLWILSTSGPARIWLVDSSGKPALHEVTAGAGHDLAIAHANGSVRVLWIDGGKIFDQRLNPSTGGPDGDPVPSPLPAASIQSTVWFWIRLILTAALAIALVASARGSRERQELALNAEKLRLASLSTRFTAGIIDVLPALLLSWLFSSRFQDRFSPDIHPLITLGVASGTYILFTTVFEIAFSRSLGKMLTGLHVVGLDGRAAGMGARTLRNVLRIIDLVGFPLALIVFSPLRQRAGDLAAGTLVVKGKPEEKAEPLAEKDDRSSQKDEG